MSENKKLELFGYQQLVCQHLRTKAIYIPGGNRQNLTKNNPETHYWCNANMSNMVGPDDKFIAPDSCQFHRSCFHNVYPVLVNKDQDLRKA